MTLHYYVSSSNGSDDNAGTAPDSPWKTLAHVLRALRASALVFSKRSYRVNPTVTEDTVIHFSSGIYPWVGALSGIELAANLFFYGDGAGQSGDDGFTQLSSGVVLAGSTQKLLVTAGLTEDQYRGKTVIVLTGAAAGDRRTIRNNTTTDIVPVAPFSAALAANDTYRIVEPAVEFQVGSKLSGDDPAGPTIIGVGRHGAFAPQWRNAAPGYGVHFVNLRLGATVASAATLAFWSFFDSAIVFVGVELVRAAANQFFVLQSDEHTIVHAGMDYMASGGQQLTSVKIAGLATTSTAWRGWGVATSPTSFDCFLQLMCGVGYVVFSTTTFHGGRWWFVGGRFYGSGGSTLTVRSAADITIGDYPAATQGIPVLLTHTGASDIRNSILKVAGASSVNVLHARFEKTNRGSAIQAVGTGDHEGTLPGSVSLAGDTGLVEVVGITGTEAPSYGLLVRGGGRINFLDGYLVVSGTFPATQQTAAFSARINVGAPDAKQDLATYAADGDSIAALDGSRIQRL